MDGELLKKYMQNIEDYVFIEEKIVTYLWLCQILKIHVNTAKQLLHTFSKSDEFKNKLLITYIVGGDLKNGKGKLVKLVIADSRESVKQLFSEVTTDHVFSIQRIGGTYSKEDIFNSNPNFAVPQECRRFCTIKAEKDVEKREIKHITEVKNLISTKQSVPSKKNTVKVTEEPKKESKRVSPKKEPSDSTSKESAVEEPPNKVKKTSAKDKDVKTKGSIGSFFSRQAEKKNVEPSENKEKGDKKEKSKPSGIGAFLKPGNKNEVNKDHIKEATEEKKTNQVEDIKESIEESHINGSANKSIKDKKPKNKVNKKKRKKRNEEEDAPRKRRRIKLAVSSDSESTDNESSEDEMEVEPEQPPPPPTNEDDEDIIPPTPTPGRKRIRKQIDKMFTDDDGFIITKKEYVYESCTDDEAVEEKLENKENNLDTKEESPKEKSPEKKKEKSPKTTKSRKSNDKNSNKQSAITNFFKRKATS